MNILNYFTAQTFGWILLGGLLVLGLLACLRLLGELRGGQKSFQVRHLAMEKRIRQTESETEEFNKTMHNTEQLHILSLALQEALLVCKGGRAFMTEQEDCLCLHIENSQYYVIFKENKHVLRSTRKTLHGQGHFLVYDNELLQDPPLKVFYDLKELELYLLQKMHGEQKQILPPALRKQQWLAQSGETLRKRGE